MSCGGGGVLVGVRVADGVWCRSPSPAPQYDNFGRRVNTREYRYRKRLEDERHKLIDKAMKTIPNYHPPSDYRRPTKTQEKIYVPVNDYPEINFSILTPLLTIAISHLHSLGWHFGGLQYPEDVDTGHSDYSRPSLYELHC